MKFTDGFWLARAGGTTVYAKEAYDFRETPEELVVTALTRVVVTRGAGIAPGVGV